jgi:hypothetical protein
MTNQTQYYHDYFFYDFEKCTDLIKRCDPAGAVCVTY